MSRDGAHEATWLLDPRWDDVPSAMPAAFAGAIGLDAGGRFVLLAPHPDDETLGLGATLADLSDAGHDLLVVLLTDGGASHPRCGHVTAPELIARRNDEFTAAVALLAPRARVVRLGFSDGSLPAEADALAAALEGLLEKGDVVLAPLPDDGHTDHDAAGVVAARVVAESQAVDGAHAESAPMRLLHYPVWRWRRSDPDRFPFDRALLLTPSATALHRKERAIGGYTSQTAPLTAFPGGETVVGPADLAPHRRLVETLVVPASDPALYRRIAASTVAEEPSPVARRLAQMFTGGTDSEGDGVAAGGVDGARGTEHDDPWRTRTSWYEARKRALCLAALARPRYERVLDIGCSVGTLTAELATRADEGVAIDGTPQALRHARSRYADLGHVRWVDGQVPDDLPAGPFDLVVLSEVGYFLTGAELLGALRHARLALRPGGEILLCDWTHPTRDIPLDGELVHRQAVTALGLTRRVALIDPDFALDVYVEEGVGPDPDGPDPDGPDTAGLDTAGYDTLAGS